MILKSMTTIAAALTLAGCGLPIERAAQPQPDKAVPFRLLDADAPPLVPSAEEPRVNVELCFIADRRLVPVATPVAKDPSPEDLVRALATPPVDSQTLRSALSDVDLIRSVKVTGGVALVDLAPEVATTGTEAQLLLIAQLVCTLTARPGIGQVAFRLDGAPVQVPAPDGAVTSGLVARDDYAALFG